MLVSIVIPCYNSEKWIAYAIESALNQDIEDKEVIVIDDGSSDGSLDIIESFYDKISYKDTENKGGNFARNTGLEMATGKWVQFLDSDDYLKSSKIRNQLESFDSLEDEVDLIYSPMLVEEWDNDRVHYYVSGPSLDLDIYAQWLSWSVSQTGTVLWRREALNSIGGWNETYPCCQDNEVIFRALKAKKNIHYYEAAESVYRHWSQDTVCRKNPEKVIEVKTQLIEECLEFLKEENLLTEEHSQLAGISCFEMARELSSKLNLDKAAEYYKEQSHKGIMYGYGPACPRSYKYALKLFGFRIAELIADFNRKLKS